MLKRGDLEAQVRWDYLYLLALFGVITAGRVLYFLNTADRALGIQGTSAWLASGVMIGIETALYFGLGLVLATDTWRWRRTIGLAGALRWSVLKDYRWLATHRQNQLQNSLAGSIGLLVLFTGLGFTFSHRFTAAGFFCVGVMILSTHMQTLQPAAVLYLASSARNKVALHALMTRENPFIRVVALLDMPDVVVPGKGVDEWMAMVIGNNGLRTADHSIWREAVTRLSKHVPLIAIDARDATAGVVFEMGHLVREGLAFKTIWIVGSDRQAPLLRALADEWMTPAPTIVIATEHTISPLIRVLTRDRTLLPTEGRDLSAVLKGKTNESLETLAATMNLVEIGRLSKGRTEAVTPVADEGHLSTHKAEAPVTSTSRPPHAEKCSACGYWKPMGEWICPSCGHGNRVRIGTAAVCGTLFIVIAFVTIEWWRWLWMTLGGLLSLTALHQFVILVRARRRSSSSSPRRAVRTDSEPT